MITQPMDLLHSVTCNMEARDLSRACREVASHFEGDVGVTLFDWYDAINTHFFEGRLPQAFILTSLTPYGGCIGLTKPNPHAQPIILIHPTLDTDERRFYTLLHEAIHVNVRYNLRKDKGYGGKTSHSIPEWLAEVNRIAPMLGYTDIRIGENKVKRTSKTTIKRINTGTVPYECSYCFPQALEGATGKPLPSIDQFIVTSHEK